jgi:RND family efflux transporter MFP subunit
MKKKWFFAVMILGILILACGKKEEAVIEKPIPVQGLKIETIHSSPVGEEYEAVGTVRSKLTSVLSSKTVGNIQTVHVHEGDRVHTGQLLIEIDNRDTRAQLQKAQAGLREVQDAEQEIEQNIQAAESAREAAEAGRALAQATYNRYKALLDEKSVSRQEFDEVQAKLKIAEAEVSRAGRMYQGLLARKSQVVAKSEEVKADVAGAQVYVGYGRILSPINGIVTAKQAEVGLLAAPGVPLLTLEDHSYYRLEVSVEDSVLSRIRLGAPVSVYIDALGPQEFPCKVSEIVPASDPGSRSSTVKIDLANLKDRVNAPSVLRSGLYGKARFRIGEKQVLLVPQKAVLRSGQLVSVFTVDSSDTLRLRLIKPGKERGDQLEVLSGLNEGDRVVVEGVERAKEGAQVQASGKGDRS